MTPPTADRIRWVDQARGLAVLLIVLPEHGKGIDEASQSLPAEQSQSNGWRSG